MRWWHLKQNIHAAWLIAIISISCVVGIWCASVIPQGWFAELSWLLSGGMLGLSVLWWRYVWMVPLAVIGGMVIGLWRGSIDQTELHAYDDLNVTTIELRGVVDDDPAPGKTGEYVVRMGRVSYGLVQLPGTVWLTVPHASDLQRSDQVTVQGKLQKGFGTFAGTMYRADIRQVDRPQPGDVALQVRNWFSNQVKHVLPSPESALGLGFLLGQREQLPSDLQDALRTAGLMHIVVASGYNLTILVRLARRLFIRISRFSALAVAGGMVLGFLAITGLSPSMSRAALVTGLSLLAWYYGRRFHPIVLLTLAAAITTLIHPSYAWGDIGWQLSFAAFAGVMLLAPLIQAYFFGTKKPGVVRQIIGETIAAQLTTMPIIILTFGQISTVAILTNILVVPLIPLAMLLTFMIGIANVGLPWFASLLAIPTVWLLGYMIHVAIGFAQQPWALVEVHFGVLSLITYYLVLLGVGYYLWRRTRYNFRHSSIVE